MDNELKGEGNSYDFGLRLSDPRAGRWLSLDSDHKPDQSNYVFTRNNPIIFVDPDGRDDWYFDLTTNSVYVIRNGKPNNYYITEFVWPSNRETREKGAYAGHTVTKQYSSHSKEISSIFTNNTDLYRRALSMYPRDSQNYRDIYYSHKSIDGGKLMLGVLGFPVAVIGIAYAAPVITAEASLLASSGPAWVSTFSSAGVTGSFFTLNSVRTGLANATVTAGSQYVGNGFDLGAVDPFQTATSGFLGGYGSLLLQSSFSMSSDNKYMFKMNNLQETSVNLSMGIIGNRINREISSVGLSSFSSSVGGFLEGTFNLGTQSGLEALGNEIQKDLNNNEE